MKNEINNVTDSAGKLNTTLTLLGKNIKLPLIQLNTNRIYNADALTKFNQELEKGTPRAQSYNKYISGMSKSTKLAALEIYNARKECDKGNISLQTRNEQINNVITSTQNLSASQRFAAAATNVLNVALNALTQIGIMAFFSLIAYGVNQVVEKINKFKSSIDDVNSKAQELKGNIQEMSKHSELASEFEKLSKGVNSLGENVSLTSDEYNRYHEIVNQIAEDLPERIIGYDSEGNAILNLKENVESLTAAYKEAKKESIGEYYYSKEGKQQRKDALENASNTLNTKALYSPSVTEYYQTLTAPEAVKFLQEISKYTQESLLKALKDNKFSAEEINYLKYLGIDEESIQNDFEQIRKNIDIGINGLTNTINNSAKAVKEILNQSLWVDVDFQSLSDREQTALSTIVQNLGFDELGKLAEGGEEAIQDYVGNLIDTYIDAFHRHSAEIEQSKAELLSLDFSEMSITDAKSKIDMFYANVSDLLGGVDVDTVKLIYPLDIDFDGKSIDELFEKEEALTKQIEDKFYQGMSETSDGIGESIRAVFDELDINTEVEIVAFGKLVAQYDTLDEAKAAFVNATDEEINALAELHDSFEYANYSDQVKDIAKNTKTLNDAIAELDKNGKLEDDTLQTLIDTFPEYSEQILAARDNSGLLKNVLMSADTAERNSLLDTLNNLQGLSEEDQQALNGLKTYIEQVNKTTTNGVTVFKDWSEVLKDVSDKESILDSIHKELDQDGHISISTYQKLIEAGSDYADLVTIENGQLKINEQAYKDLVVQKYKDQVASIELAKAEKIRELAVKSSIGATQEEIQVIRDEITALAQASEAAKGNVDKALELWNNYDPDDGSSSSSSKTKASYSNDLQLLKDQLNDRVITYEQFLQRWQALNDKYHNMSEEYGGISDYEWGQNNREIIAERTKAYEEEKKALQELYEAGKISLDEYNKRVNASLNHWLGGYAQLSDEFKAQTKENAEFAKTHFFDELDREIDDLQDKYAKTGDTHYLDEQEKLIKGDDKSGLGYINKQLEALYANGLDESNSEVQFWLDKQKEYNGQLEDILDERNDIIDTNLKESRESYDETYTKTGDNSVFLQEIKDIESAQKAKLALIEEYKKLGYTEDSDVIKGLRDEIKGLGDDILDVNQKYADSIVDLADKNAEAIEKEIGKTGNVDKYYDIANVYYDARKQIGQMIADEYAKGKEANYSYIQSLQGQYDDLGEKIQDTFDSITKAITDNVDEQIENIDRGIKETGDYSKIYDKIGVYKSGKESIKTQIAMRLAEGYTEESEEVKELLEQIQGYDDNILDVYTELADRIDTETQKQLDVIDREIKRTGDTKQYQIKLNVLVDSKQSLEDLKNALIKAGVNANSEIIKDLDSRIQALDDDITDTSRERADAQADAYAEVMGLETERLEKYKKEQDEIFDAKIKALEEQKKKLEEQNEEIERQNELQEKQKAILDAQRGVIKSLRMVYSGNGQWTVKPTEESMEALKEAENDLDETLRKQQIEAIDDLIDVLKDQKSTFDEAIGKQTTAIEEGVKAFEKSMTDSYKVYNKLDYELIKSIVGEDAANTYQKNFNEYYDKNVTDNDTVSTDNTTATENQTKATENQTEATNEQTKSTATLTGFFNRAGEAAEKFVDNLGNIAYDNFSKQMQDEYGLGNVDLTKRPFVGGEKMRQVGYDVDKNGTSTVFSGTEFLWQGNEENGKYVAVHYTPILPNGEVLTEQEMTKYLKEVLEGSENILDADTKGLVLKVDTDFDISEEDIKSLESGQLTQHMKDILDATDEWDIQLHNVQEKWMELWKINFGELNAVKTDNSTNTSSAGGLNSSIGTLDAEDKQILQDTVDLFGGVEFKGFLGTVQKIANGELSVGILPTSIEALNQVASGANIVDQQTINNISNFTPNINNNFTINAPANSAEEIRNAVTGVIDDKIVQSFRAFYDGYYQQSMREMYGN